MPGAPSFASFAKGGMSQRVPHVSPLRHGLRAQSTSLCFRHHRQGHGIHRLRIIAQLHVQHRTHRARHA